MSRSEEEIIHDIGENILTNLSFAVHVFVTIREAQQEVEKIFGVYAGSDGKGFQAWETREMNDLYEQKTKTGWLFSPTEATRFQRKVYKYRRQFRRLTKPRIEAQLQRMGA